MKQKKPDDLEDDEAFDQLEASPEQILTIH